LLGGHGTTLVMERKGGPRSSFGQA
jgi:hypothetical protein